MIRLVLPAALVALPARAQPAEPVLAAIPSAYGLAFVALAGWAVLMLVLSIVGVATPYGAKTESGHPVRDYDDRGYRAYRAHQNALEASGPFVAVAVAAILAGAPPFWVNLLAALFLAARIATAAVHVGTTNQAARSGTWALGVLCVLGLAVLATVAALAA